MGYQDRTLSQLKTRLNTLLRNGVNNSAVTFTDAEVTEALSVAINDDENVFAIQRDTSLTTIANTRSYTVPSQFEDIYEVWIDFGGDTIGTKINRRSWRVVDGNLEFMQLQQASKPIYLYGKVKLTDADPIPESLQKLVIYNAAIYLIELLLSSKVTRFLPNATTVAELQSALALYERKAADAKAKLPNRRWSVEV